MVFLDEKFLVYDSFFMIITTPWWIIILSCCCDKVLTLWMTSKAQHYLYALFIKKNLNSENVFHPSNFILKSKTNNMI